MRPPEPPARPSEPPVPGVPPPGWAGPLPEPQRPSAPPDPPRSPQDPPRPAPDPSRPGPAPDPLRPGPAPDPLRPGPARAPFGPHPGPGQPPPPGTPAPGAFSTAGETTHVFATRADAPAGPWQQQPTRDLPPVPGRPAQQPGWGGAPGWQDAPASAGGWSYVDSIRSSELVPSKRQPPRRGWRRAVYRGSLGLINPGPSPDERRQAALEMKIRSLLRGRYKIGVLGKGGVGKTTIAASVGSVFAELRQDDRVVAIDADTSFGKLGSRIDPNAAGSYWELAADQHLDTFADVRSRVGNNAAGLFVLAGENSAARRRVLDPGIYREATSRLDRHFTISIIDCGSTMDAPVTQEVLRDLDALIVVSSPWVDGASAAGQTMEWLANRGLTGLLHRTVVVLNDSDGHADKRTRSILVQQFASRGQVVIEVPFDPHLRPGGVIDVTSELNPTTRRRIIEIAAAIAEHFASTTDGPRGGR
ncbi:MinD/ParA family protein [Mycobacterium sp. MYCO198283]|uniref:nucleotide-binding protein n=1 Tax=Mycobacterium sp. MYCO198283 TaxID=2883505 RepID=UPI0035ABF5D6